MQQQRKESIFVFNKYFLKKIRATTTACQHRSCLLSYNTDDQTGENSVGGGTVYGREGGGRDIHKALDGNPERVVGL